MMSHDKLNYLDVLREQGYRLTRQRQVILEAICQAGGHATIGEVVHRTRLVERGIDRSTVYRTINLFVKLGLVNVAEDENGERTYEIVQEEHHHHLICKRCGAEIEMENQLVDEFYRGLKAAYQYQVQMDHLIVFGVCPRCGTQAKD